MQETPKPTVGGDQKQIGLRSALNVTSGHMLVMGGATHVVELEGQGQKEKHKAMYIKAGDNTNSAKRHGKKMPMHKLHKSWLKRKSRRGDKRSGKKRRRNKRGKNGS